ncbi:DUF7009 family protein [Paludibaculum fermentans]|uniref:DUF7009 family protein n=1 Tax=Paludibaculum fermentans TaxID=1473598 RepID=UPI003EBCFE38
MKLRIQDSSLRFRLTQKEVSQLRDCGWVEAEVPFDPRRPFRYSIFTSENVQDLVIDYSPDSIRVVLPPSVVNDWANSDQVSIAGRGRIQVLVEKDFQCLHGPDRWDPDAWPNPLLNSSPSDLVVEPRT